MVCTWALAAMVVRHLRAARDQRHGRVVRNHANPRLRIGLLHRLRTHRATILILTSQMTMRNSTTATTPPPHCHCHCHHQRHDHRYHRHRPSPSPSPSPSTQHPCSTKQLSPRQPRCTWQQTAEASAQRRRTRKAGTKQFAVYSPKLTSTACFAAIAARIDASGR